MKEWILIWDRDGAPIAYRLLTFSYVYLTTPAVFGRPGGPGAVIEALNRAYAHV